MVRSVTKDLIFDSLLACEDKSFEFKKAYLSGLISGINVQMSLVKVGESRAYDGSLGAILRTNSSESFETMTLSLSPLLRDLLKPDLFVNYDLLKTNDFQTYLIGLGTGQIEVSKKFNILIGLGILDKSAVEIMSFWAESTCSCLQLMF